VPSTLSKSQSYADICTEQNFLHFIYKTRNHDCKLTLVII